VSAYPKEWPGFVLLSDGPFVKAGAILEMVAPGVVPRNPDIALPTHFGLRLVRGVLGNDGSVNLSVHPDDGWIGIQQHLDDLRPLTPAARELLAEVFA
jgi:hypothetical protein